MERMGSSYQHYERWTSFNDSIGPILLIHIVIVQGTVLVYGGLPCLRNSVQMFFESDNLIVAHVHGTSFNRGR